MVYFCNILQDALQDSKNIAVFTLKKSTFSDKFKTLVNERQLKAIQKMMDAGTEDLKGRMTAAKYISIYKTSKAPATRDLQCLAELGAFIISGGGHPMARISNP